MYAFLLILSRFVLSQISSITASANNVILSLGTNLPLMSFSIMSEGPHFQSNDIIGNPHPIASNKTIGSPS